MPSEHHMLGRIFVVQVRQPKRRVSSALRLLHTPQSGAPKPCTAALSTHKAKLADMMVRVTLISFDFCFPLYRNEPVDRLL